MAYNSAELRDKRGKWTVGGGGVHPDRVSGPNGSANHALVKSEHNSTRVGNDLALELRRHEQSKLASGVLGVSSGVASALSIAAFIGSGPAGLAIAGPIGAAIGTPAYLADRIADYRQHLKAGN